MRDAEFLDESGFGPAGPERLAALRACMAAQDLTGFIIPRADEHQGEYVPRRAQRLAWLTGFTGSAGLAVVLARKAAVFVDGRYTLQVRQEVDETLFTPIAMAECPHTQWLADNLTQDDRLGFDPWLHTWDQVNALRKAVEQAGAQLIACTANPLDEAWTDQPAPPLAPVRAHGPEYAGKTSEAKRGEIAANLHKDKQDAVILTDPSSIAWLLNIRGGDVGYTPLPLGFAILHVDSRIDLFMERAKLSPAVLAHLGPQAVIHPPADFAHALDGLNGRRVRVDPAMAAFAVFERLEQAGAAISKAADPCALPRACKNTVELDGSRAAHRRDAVAMVRFLHWLAGQTGVDELGVSEKLEALRAEGAHFQGLSFATIAGSGPNGAIVHYRSSPTSNRVLQPGELFLLDSGAQYLDGTTDITRTVAIGRPGDEERQRFTLVLKGHIAVSRAIFPTGTNGSQLDVLARQSLWRHGLDYDHGTGHGVGSFLSVHEGPQRISKMGAGAVPLKPGMILSNEPGYYKTGAYGIRIENLIVVTEHPRPQSAERDLLAFEPLTLVPYDRSLIDTTLLDADERGWVDAYHALVRDTLSPLLDSVTKAWLTDACAPLG